MVLSGRHVRLRELRDTDLPELVQWWQDPELAINQVTGSIHPRTADALADMFRGWARDSDGGFGLTIATRDDDRCVGQVALFGATVRTRCATLAIMVGPPYQNRGYGTDAVRTAVRYGFTELGLHRIQLTANGYNPRAIATYTKCGFVEEGRSRETVLRGGVWYHHVHMGILDREWSATHE